MLNFKKAWKNCIICKHVNNQFEIIYFSPLLIRRKTRNGSENGKWQKIFYDIDTFQHLTNTNKLFCVEFSSDKGNLIVKLHANKYFTTHCR